MQRFQNTIGNARHGLERMTPNGFMSRQHVDLSTQHASKRSFAPQPLNPTSQGDGKVHLSFNIPFSSTLFGPDPAEVLYATPNALQKWTFPTDTPENTPAYQLPVHADNVEGLRKLCRILTESSVGGMEAIVKCTEAKLSRTQGLLTNVCVSGEAGAVYNMKTKILHETPILLKHTSVTIDTNLVVGPSSYDVRPDFLNHLEKISKWTGTDLFLINPPKEAADEDLPEDIEGHNSYLNVRLCVGIYGDPESIDHARTRVLILIDQILKRTIDVMRVEKTLHNIICGRTRKNVRRIEAVTNTAIYLPHPFSRILGYLPYGAQRRGDDEFFITGERQEDISRAKVMLQDTVINTRCHVKEIPVASPKIDAMILDRLEKLRRIMEVNGTYIGLPTLNTHRALIRVQGTEQPHIDRTVREIMLMAGQFYSASWWISPPDGSNMSVPSPADIQAMLADISMNSGAEVGFQGMEFSISGSDDAVKAALKVIQDIPYVNRCQSQIRVKIELADDHKEFIAGKKNGKINKIMGQSLVQIMFDGYNDYNFYVDVCGSQYQTVANGVRLVELELPSQISFHVPDFYHKRIIGVGGTNIQKIMKKYSVFVKFSNAQDRGATKEDEEYKVDNVVIRTPSRNVETLEAVKQDIIDMVDKADAEYVSELVAVHRLYHRQLFVRYRELELLENKWNCRVEIPSTECAGDVIIVSGPEFQVPQAIDQLLGMIPEDRELTVTATPALRNYLRTDEFDQNICKPMRERYVVNLHVIGSFDQAKAAETTQERILLRYYRNVEGAAADAVEFLISSLAGFDIDRSKVKGAFPRPKSDTFEDSLPFFNTKLLQNSQPPSSTDSPTRSTFGDDRSDRGSIFNKLRKQGSMTSITSMFGNCRVSGSSGSLSLFKQASSNASKASLISMESRESGYRNPWNDSGVNLPEEDGHHKHHWPTYYSSKFPFGVNSGDMTPRHDVRASFDSGRPSTSHSLSAYPAPIGPPTGPHR